jgi:hypothetical protein
MKEGRNGANKGLSFLNIFISIWWLYRGFHCDISICIHILYPGLIHPLHYSLSYPIHFPLLKITSPGSTVPYSYMNRKCINISTLFYPLHLPSPPTSALSLTWPVLHSCPSLFKCLSIVEWGFCLGISPVNILCLNQSDSLHCCSFCFSSDPILFTSFQCGKQF